MCTKARCMDTRLTLGAPNNHWVQREKEQCWDSPRDDSDGDLLPCGALVMAAHASHLRGQQPGGRKQKKVNKVRLLK